MGGVRARLREMDELSCAGDTTTVTIPKKIATIHLRFVVIGIVVSERRHVRARNPSGIREPGMSEIIYELFAGDARLLQNSAECAHGQFWVQGNNATGDAIGTLAF